MKENKESGDDDIIYHFIGPVLLIVGFLSLLYLYPRTTARKKILIEHFRNSYSYAGKRIVEKSSTKMMIIFFSLLSIISILAILNKEGVI